MAPSPTEHTAPPANATRHEARRRIISARMSCWFAGGVLGVILVGLVYPQRGWTGVGVLCAALALALCLVWLGNSGIGARRPDPRPLPSIAVALVLGGGWLAVIAAVLRLTL
ncbi:hypothetical protein QFW96_25420 [Saccharopolyspora sp. TS4A08]|uniref:DUF202 domain-containing protein n=1 Tax=Saccharopolyspora ipomoeae TaxID=3042027 RepID=A0ABT6PWI9_9PSEU|nr:hypothetical protein [Saccharopolyspora sp. TS4A08]MDI2031988.1 hypothetical protein [Saccharopolyspora sp. TS4A08]